MSTYSVYNIKVDNKLSFTPGATAGSVLSIDADGNTCLLYTSPSPRDRTRSRMPSSA